MVFILGLTGSIGMGKTATADLFRHYSVPVYDADATVHRLYQGEAIEPILKSFPEAVGKEGVDRKILSSLVLGRPGKLKLLESIIHPLVRAQEALFMKKALDAGYSFVVLDSPLLLETRGEKRCDAIAVVSAPPDIQKQRVLSRPDMDEKKLNAILAQQMPDDQKRQKAHFIIDSSRGLEDAASQVRDILRCLSARPGRAKTVAVGAL